MSNLGATVCHLAVPEIIHLRPISRRVGAMGPLNYSLETEQGAAGFSRYPVKEKVMLRLKYLGLVGFLGLSTMHCGTDAAPREAPGSGGKSGGTGGSANGTGG